MIFFDVTKAKTAGHRSGLIRVSQRLALELGSMITPVDWKEWNRQVSPNDWFLTAELFSEEERPGWNNFLSAKKCRTAAIFHDAIPLKYPHTTWPKSVARHPGYMKALAGFDLVFAVSKASRDELLGYWQWLGLERIPRVEVLVWGADFNGQPRVRQKDSVESLFLCVGILEPRKNQSLLLDVAGRMWSDGHLFELHFVGRVNPHFGQPIVQQIKTLRKKGHPVFHHDGMDDGGLEAMYRRARCTLFPTQAEGCGLPLLESLWLGTPCICSDLPVLAENAGGGGCLQVALNDVASWQETLGEVLQNDALYGRIAGEAVTRSLPEWREAAGTIVRGLGV